MARILHDWQKGLNRLLAAPTDLPETLPRNLTPPRKDFASAQHAKLFEEYRDLLESAVEIAVQWWDGIVQTRMARGQSEQAALRSAYMQRPAGPASRPEVIWVVRRFWLACDAINKQVNRDDRVPPEIFLLSWLADAHLEEMVQVLSGMPYWPIGLTDSGHWV